MFATVRHRFPGDGGESQANNIRHKSHERVHRIAWQGRCEAGKLENPGASACPAGCQMDEGTNSTKSFAPKNPSTHSYSESNSNLNSNIIYPTTGRWQGVAKDEGQLLPGAENGMD